MNISITNIAGKDKVVKRFLSDLIKYNHIDWLFEKIKLMGAAAYGLSDVSIFFNNTWHVFIQNGNMNESENVIAAIRGLHEKMRLLPNDFMVIDYDVGKGCLKIQLRDM